VLHHTARWRGAVVLVAVIVLAAGMAQTSAGHAMLRATGLFEEPTRYTSLAFLHSQPLPTQLAAKRANVNVSFVIHNANGTPRDYQWSVLLVQGQRTRSTAIGTIHIAPGRGAAITRSVAINCARGKVRIVVSLALPAESIDAWTACRSRRS
jgi:hypothetical protein